MNVCSKVGNKEGIISVSARESVNMHVRMKNTMSYLSIEMKHKKSHILAVFLTKIKSKRINIAKKN